MIGVVVAGIIVFVVVAVVLARQSSSRKKMAIASLKAEQEKVGHYDILSLVDQEVADLGLRTIEGSEGLGPDILLKVWRESDQRIRDTGLDHLRYEVVDGVERTDASPSDVRLVSDSDTEDMGTTHADTAGPDQADTET